MSEPLRIAIAGITGSIGKSACNIVRKHRNSFQIVLASAHTNGDMLLELGKEFGIDSLVVTNGAKIASLPENQRIYYGKDELYKLIYDTDIDIFLNAMPGSNGLLTSFHVLSAGKKLALANKESLVLAGHLLTKLADEKGIRILPVDSEHSAIFQAIGSHAQEEIRRLYITASGGSFRDLPLNEFQHITFNDALKHPVWNMGVKVTIDSATMMNKGLECIEARWLFNIDYDRITAVIHPDSIIHSLVEFRDGSLLAQMSKPSMELPILYAMTYPHRIESDNVKTNLLELPPITFREVDFKRYPLFKLALDTARVGGLMPTIMNAANEAAIELFSMDKLRFTEIYPLIDKTLSHFTNIQDPDLETIIHFNREAYNYALFIN